MVTTKNHILLRFIIFSLLALSGTLAEGQVSVTYDTKTKSFKDGGQDKIPFDQYFEVIVLADDATSVKTKLRIVDYCEDPSSTEDCSKKYLERHYRFCDTCHVGKGWKKLGESKDFKIQVEPLHHNSRYQLHFTFKKKLITEQVKIDALRLKIANAIEETFHYSKSTVTAADAAALAPKIFRAIKATTGESEIYDERDSLVVDFLDLINSDPISLGPASQNIVTAQNDLADALTNIVGGNPAPSEYAHHVMDTIHRSKDSLIRKLDRILNDAALKEFLDRPANSVIDRATTNRQVLSLLRGDFKRSDFSTVFNEDLRQKVPIGDLQSILVGMGKIEGNIAVKADQFDLNSAHLLLSTLSSVSNLKDSLNNDIVPHPHTLDTLLMTMKTWYGGVQKFYRLLPSLEKHKQAFPDILQKTYTKWTAATNINTTADIDTKETPYIGVDFGVLVAPYIGSTFLFEGFNIHLRPVNRKAYFSDLSGLDKILKRTSVTFGIAQRVGSYDDRIQKLIGLGSPFVGLGVRANRMLRFNAGVLFYQEKSPIDIITKTEKKHTFILSASLDIKLKDAWSVFGKLITI